MRSRLLLTATLTYGLLPMLTIAACGNLPAKDGGPARPVTLTAVAYTPNTLTGETLNRFVHAVKKTSRGGVSLEPGPAMDPGTQDGSADVISMVREGKAAIGIVASRTFDLEGATSLQALNVPLIFDSPAQAAQFLSDPVTDSMLRGLGKAGVVGLALTYDQMRQPLGFDGPLKPQALKGVRVLARPSRASSIVLAAMGATADPRNGEDSEGAIRGGQVVGAETSMDRPSGLQTGAEGHTSAITGNVQMSVKANVIIVNPKAWSGLTGDQRGALHDAALATRTWAARQVVTLAASARAFCDRHIGDVTVADAAELAVWRRAVKPAVKELASTDPITVSALDRMREVVRNSPSTDVPRPCSMVRVNDLPSVQPAGDQTIVAGEWRLLVSAGRFAAAGASAQDVALNQGTWTFTFKADGTFTYLEPRGRSCSGTFALAGDRLSMQEDVTVGDCDAQWELTFVRHQDRMTWTPTPEFESTYAPLRGFFVHPLQLIAQQPR